MRPKAPDVPRGFRAPTAAQVHRLKKLTGAQLDEAPAAISELRGSTSYADDFGKRAPDAETLASQLDEALLWHAEVARAEEWLRYARAQSEIWRDASAQSLERLAPSFATALADEPALRRKYAATATVLGAAAAAARKANATKRAKTRAAKKGS